MIQYFFIMTFLYWTIQNMDIGGKIFGLSGKNENLRLDTERKGSVFLRNIDIGQYIRE